MRNIASSHLGPIVFLIAMLSDPSRAEATPRVDSINPNVGVPGTEVSIRGTGFSPIREFNRVQFAGSGQTVPLPVIPESVDPAGTEMTVIVPRTAGTGQVTVFNGTSASNGVRFTVRAPRVGSIAPNVGAPGTEVLIRGTDFSPIRDFNRVRFSGSGQTVPLPVIPESVNPAGTEITVIVPRTAGTGQVTVFNGTFASNGIRFTVRAPRITAIVPNTALPGMTILIRGSDFSPVPDFNRVQFAGFGQTVPLPVAPESVNPAGTEMAVIVPRATGTGQVTVFNGSFRSNGMLLIVQQSGLRIDSITPNVGVPGTEVSIRGSGFSPIRDFNRVQFAGSGQTVPLPVIPESVNLAGTEMIVIVPRTAGAGQVTVFNGTFPSNGVRFTVRAPRVGSIAPNVGAPGTEVLIRGTDFSPIRDFNRVRFSGSGQTVPLPVIPESVNPAGTEMIVVVPRTAGTGQVTVFNGTFPSNGVRFTVRAPRIGSIAPNVGAPGTEVLIRGTDFSPIRDFNRVRFSGSGQTVPLPVIPESVNPAGTEMIVVVPRAAGTGQVTVFNGTFPSNGVRFTVRAPRIAALVPSTAVPGTTILIRGSDFSSVRDFNRVQFAGSGQTLPLPVPPERVNAAGTEMAVTVPRAAGTGRVTVFNGSFRSNGVLLIVPASRLRIDRIQPNSGVPGREISILGSGFSPIRDFNRVRFAGSGQTVPLPVIPESVNPAGTKMNVIVPRTAGTGRVTVFNGTSLSNGFRFAINAPRIDSIVPGRGQPGDVISIRGSGFSPVRDYNRVQFAGAGQTVPLPVTPESVDPAGTEMTVIVPRAAGSGLVTTFNGSFRSQGWYFTIGSVPGTTLLVATFKGDNVLRYDGKTGHFVDEIVAPGSGGLDVALGVAVGPDDHIYVSSRDSDQVLRFDGRTGAFIDVFAAGGGLDEPTELLFGPDGHLYVSSSGSNAVLRYHGRSGAFLGAFTRGGGLNGVEGLAFGPDGHLYVASRDGDAILRYHGRTGAFIDVFAAGGGLDGAFGFAFGPDGHLYVSSGRNDRVLRYHGVTGAFLGTVVNGGALDGPIALHFGPDSQLWVLCQRTDQILRYRANGEFLGVFASGSGTDAWTWFTFHSSSEDVFAGDFETASVSEWPSVRP